MRLLRTRACILVSLLLAVPLPLALGVPAEPAWNRPCRDPWPCGPAWPRSLDGPFEYTTEPLAVESHDGAVLRGTLVLPVLPEGVRAPAVLIAIPYWGEQYPAPGEVDRPSLLGAEPWELLARNGFAVAAVNVRGSGASDGCLEMWGANERRDMRVLVEWLAAQPWSNERVGAMGLSYGSGTAFEAAVEAPDALKAIAVAALVGDAYTVHYSPQGLAVPYFQMFRVGYQMAHGHDVCPEALRNAEDAATGWVRDDRDAAFWSERDLYARFSNITAAVFVTDSFPGAHDHQIAPVWSLIPSPKRMLLGQWAHEYPTTPTWDADLVEWFDFWLKGIGRVEDLGKVDWSDNAGQWRTSDAWPPASGTRVPIGQGAFRSTPATVASDPGFGLARACPAGAGTPEASGLVLPIGIEGPVVVAGNAAAHLRITSDQPGGSILAQLVDLAPGHTCAGTLALDAVTVTWGGADLRFHEGGYDGGPFPVGTPVGVRIDLTARAHALPAGHRLALVLDGEHLAGAAPRWTPRIEVLEGSVVEVPLVR